MKRLVTERLTLEPVRSDNAAVLWKIVQAGQLREFQDVPRYARDEFVRRVASRPKYFDARTVGRFEWLLSLTASHIPIGWASLRVAERGGGSAEIGYSLLAAYRAAGHGSAAVRAIVRYAFEESDLARIDACCVPGNVPSRRLLKSIGFEQVRVQRHGAIVRSRPVDIVMFELTKERWRAMASALAPRHAGSANSIVMPASANPK